MGAEWWAANDDGQRKCDEGGARVAGAEFL